MGSSKTKILPQEEKFERLPEIVRPTHYDIYLKPNLKTFKFDGHVTIHIEVQKPTDFIKFHANELEIRRVRVKFGDDIELKTPTFEVNPKLEFVTVKFEKVIDPQNLQIFVDFSGIHNAKLFGFYRGSYKDTDGNTKFLVSTHFESTAARKAFPCWDEPIYKAKFDITLEICENLTAVSNMPLISDEKTVHDTKILKFATTPLMSSYLVAFAVGEFEYVEGITQSGIPVRVYMVKGKKDQGLFPLEIAIKAIDFYNSWFDLKYPLPKVDLIAVPDFNMGAMENWGLITFREVMLLADPKKATTQMKIQICLIIAHEIAHFWFGDLVTMKWWSDLWLKEGFAKFMEYVFTAYNYPEFYIWEYFVGNNFVGGFELDGLRASHPIEADIENPNELNEIFDNITYAKSSCLNRMLCYYLSEPIFQAGLRKYLKKFAYNNAETADLWNALSEASGQDINTMMSSWTKVMGFPLVTVTQKIEPDKRILKLCQERFLYHDKKDTEAHIWQIPINIITSSNPDQEKKFLFLKREDHLVLDGVKLDDWVKLNAGTTGFYRVHYSKDMLQSFFQAIEKRELNKLDRFGIAEEMFALVEAGKIPVSEFLTLVKTFIKSNENDYVVWSTIDNGISKLANCLSRHPDPKLLARFNRFIYEIFEPLAEKLCWEPKQDENAQISLLRVLVYDRLVKSGHQLTIEKCQQFFAYYLTNPATLHPELRTVVFNAVARNSGKEVIDQLLHIYETCNYSEVERECIIALGQASDIEILREIYEYAFTQNKIRVGDYKFFIFGSKTTKNGQDLLWEYCRKNIKTIVSKFDSPTANSFLTAFKNMFDSHCGEEKADEFLASMKNNLDLETYKLMTRPIQQLVENIRVNSRLLKENSSSVDQWLSENGY